MLTKIATAHMDSPLGFIRITGTDRGIDSITFSDHALRGEESPTGVLAQCVLELREYFSGKRQHFTVPLVMRATDFQQSVWDALLQIPFGKTVSYGEIAKEIGNPGAVRAIGTAVGDNPLAIIVPCHRVIPATGGIGEYAFGTEKKEWLLGFEQRQP